MLFQRGGNHRFDFFVRGGDEVGGYGAHRLISRFFDLVGKGRAVQFIFVSVPPRVGRADVIILPALRAISTRRSWISWRLGSAMMGNGLIGVPEGLGGGVGVLVGFPGIL